jgi:hypothetical protein
LPDGLLLITAGHLRIYANGKLSEPVAGVPKVEYHEQGGLLDVLKGMAVARGSSPATVST